MPVPTGNLKERVDIEYIQQATVNSYNIPQATWLKLYQNVPAQLSVTSANPEKWIGEKPETMNFYCVWMRYLGDVTTDMRLRIGTRVFNITSIDNPDERRIDLRIMVKEVIGPAPKIVRASITGTARIAHA